MRDQLCDELAQMANLNVLSMHDARLPAAQSLHHSLVVETDFDASFDQCLANADLIWLIAPECDDILYALTARCEAAGVPVIGANTQVVALASDKLKTADWLREQAINTPDTLPANAWFQQKQTSRQMPCLAKPVKGVGCEGIVYFQTEQAANAWYQAQNTASLANYCMQAYLPGQAASLSMLCYQGRAYLLSCNQLRVDISNGTIQLTQIVVNGLAQYWPLFEACADKIAANLPNMIGYLGVDVILDAQTQQLSVLEINPRLSSSYAGLSAATGVNIAALLLTAQLESTLLMPTISRQPVTIDL